MTINSDLSRARYVGNGVTNTFAIPFAYLTNNDGTAQIAVYLGDSDTPLIEGKDYTVKGFGKYSDANDQIDEDLITYETRYENGEFTLNNAPMIGEAVAVVRNVPQTQGVVFVEGEKFPAKDFENALDKLTMQVQEIKENMERSIILPPTSTEKPIEVRDNIIQTAKEAQQTSDEAVILIKEAVQEINTTVEENIEKSRIWAEGEQEEVETLGGTLSSRGNADLAMAIANADEDVPIDASGLIALDVIKGPKGDKGDPGKDFYDGYVTNCIIEIPQDIKLELNNGILTLKAGSKIYKPKGFEADGVTRKFEEYIVKTDRQYTSPVTTETTLVFFITGSEGFTAISANVILSGSTIPTTGVIYNTDTNIISFYRDSVLEWTNGTLPFAIVKTSSTGKLISIEHIFNGFGYNGNTIFALPNVKGLIPNGRNEDGSLKNIEFTIDRVHIQTFTSTDNFPEATYWLTSTGDFGGANANINYHNNINKVLYDVDGTSRAYCNAGSFTVVNGKITSFTPKLPFRALDYSDKPQISSWGMPSNKYIDLTAGATGSKYTAPANGWFTLKGNALNANLAQVALWKTDGGMGSRSYSYTATAQPWVYLPVKKGEIILISAHNLENIMFRFYYAEGEN